MYYLYHIPGKKIGVTTNLLKRVTKTQGYKSGEYEIILSSDDIDFISDQERKLQKKHSMALIIIATYLIVKNLMKI